MGSKLSLDVTKKSIYHCKKVVITYPFLQKDTCALYRMDFIGQNFNIIKIIDLRFLYKHTFYILTDGNICWNVNPQYDGKVPEQSIVISRDLFDIIIEESYNRDATFDICAF